MIDENFINAAIRIRREYLKINSNLEMYRRRAREISGNLDNLLKKIEEIQEKAYSKNADSEGILQDINKVMKDFEDEGNKLEKLIEPLNQQVEKLAIEEQELWRSIKTKHNSISDDLIIEYVKQRLIKENLSK